MLRTFSAISALNLPNIDQTQTDSDSSVNSGAVPQQLRWLGHITTKSVPQLLQSHMGLDRSWSAMSVNRLATSGVPIEPSGL
jgi:hypothetical protein